MVETLSDKSQSVGFMRVLRIAWPASLVMLNTTLLRFVDGLMVSHLGHDEFGAQYASGMLSFAPEAFAMGALIVVNTFVSQNLGAGRRRMAARYAWAGMLIGLVFALAQISLLFPSARVIFGWIGHEPHIQNMETMYFRYMIIAAAFTLPSRALAQFFFGIHRSRVVWVVSLLTNGFNVLANYILIFGKFGAPKLGLQGAAIGSTIAWGLQLAILLVLFLHKTQRRRFSTHMFRTVRWQHCRDLIRVGWPAGVQLGNDILCRGLFTAWIVGTYFGKIHMAATTVAIRYMGLSFMPAVGLGLATTAIVGRHIGNGRPDLVRKSSHISLMIALIYMGICGLCFWLLRYPMANFFLRNVPQQNISAEQVAQTVNIATKVMLCAAVFQLFDAVGIIYIGALRGAGDTIKPMLITLALSWPIVIGGGFIMARYVPQLTSIGPWITASVYVCLLGCMMAWRFESGAWRKIDLLKHTPQTPNIFNP